MTAKTIALVAAVILFIVAAILTWPWPSDRPYGHTIGYLGLACLAFGLTP
jgi:hypothetical protein